MVFFLHFSLRGFVLSGESVGATWYSAFLVFKAITGAASALGSGLFCLEKTMETNATLMSAKDAAKKLGISTASLSRLVRENRIGVYRVGGRTMFDEEILDAYKRSVFVMPQAGRN